MSPASGLDLAGVVLPLADHPLYAGVMALVPAVVLPLVLVVLGVRERRREAREDAEAETLAADPRASGGTAAGPA